VTASASGDQVITANLIINIRSKINQCIFKERIVMGKMLQTTKIEHKTGFPSDSNSDNEGCHDVDIIVRGVTGTSQISSSLSSVETGAVIHTWCSKV
jgi:hypothetical protein